MGNSFQDQPAGISDVQKESGQTIKSQQGTGKECRRSHY